MPQDLEDPRDRVAVHDPEHLKRFLRDSGRKYIVLNALDLVDAMEWPGGVQAVMDLVRAYREHRANRPSAWTRTVESKLPGGGRATVPVFSGEFLEPDEALEAIRLIHDQTDAQEKRRAEAGAVKGQPR